MNLSIMDDPRDHECEACGKRLVAAIGMQDVMWDIGHWWHVPCATVFFHGRKTLVSWESGGALVRRREMANICDQRDR